MSSSKIRSTRRLRSWLVEQVSSGKYHGLVWDNPEKTMFRIPWKHAGKQDFRSDEDAAIFRAWAEFKGKLSKTGEADPASWKTRLRCALNKSPEFSEVQERSQLDISDPYKVYRLVPLAEQGLPEVKKEVVEKLAKRGKKRECVDKESNREIQAKLIKEEEEAVHHINLEVDTTSGSEVTLLQDGTTAPTVILKRDNMINEIQLNVMIETVPPPGDHKALHSFRVSVFYIGQQVLQREVVGSDVRIAYFPPSPSPPSLNSSSFLRVPLPPPKHLSPPPLPATPDSALRLQAIETMLPNMEKGVVLTSGAGGIYAKRFCLGRVFWRGPHCSGTGPFKMERAVEPTMLFSKDVFRQELEQFRSGGEPPKSEITLCFGEELLEGDDLTDKHIVVKISLPWAEKQIEEVETLKSSFAILQSLANQSPSGEITLNLVEIEEAYH